MIDVSECGESKEDGQKVVTSNMEVTNRSSRVKCIRGGTIWPRRKEKMGDCGGGVGGDRENG